MSGDEVLVLVISAIVAVVCWGAWYLGSAFVLRYRRRAVGEWMLYLAPPTAMALLFLVLKTAASYDVRDDVRYLALYLILGAAWVGLSIRWLPLVGVSARDDVVERGNASAAAVVGGATVAIMLCYAGGNIGDGPGWWVVVFSAALATAALFVAWALLELVSGVSDVVTIDRDSSAGVRLAAFLIAAGLIFGRGVAGDWVSVEAAVADFAAAAWPASVLLVVAAVIERWFRPTPDNPRPALVPYGFVPAVLYVSAAVYQMMRLELPV
jgi:hypothetical protein